MKAIVRLSLLLLVLGPLIVSTGVNAGGQLRLAAEYDSSNVPRTFGSDDTLRLQAQTGIAPVSVQLSWVRGRVLSVSADSITLKLRERTVTFSLDDNTAIVSGSPPGKVISADELTVERPIAGPPALGTVVQVHYIKRRAVVIVDDALSSQELSRKSGSSYLGVLEEMFSWQKYITVQLYMRGLRHHHFTVEYDAQLIDRTGHVLATSSKVIQSRLHVGEMLLVIYEIQPGGDTYQALEIRRLGPSP